MKGGFKPDPFPPSKSGEGFFYFGVGAFRRPPPAQILRQP